MKKTKIIAFFAFLIMLLFYLNFFSPFVMPWQKEETIKTALIWGGLAKLPENVKITKLRKYGSLFTREFVIEFTSSKDEIEKWIIRSKRLKYNCPKIKAKTEIYEIHPGEFNSYGGEVKVDGNKVVIHMSWS